VWGGVGGVQVKIWVLKVSSVTEDKSLGRAFYDRVV
jgi:hypothetical protein